MEFKFELRSRKSTASNFWSVFYNADTGDIEAIRAGEYKVPNALVVTFDRVKEFLSGERSQHNFKVKFDKTLGALDLIDQSKLPEVRNKHEWVSWLSAKTFQGNPVSAIRVILFNDTGIIRIEADRVWTTKIKEGFSQELNNYTIPIYIADEQDPHVIFGKESASLMSIAECGYWEGRLWSFIDHKIVQNILYHAQEIQVNVPPVTDSIFLLREDEYYPFSGVTEEQTVISHYGMGKHITIFLEGTEVWAQSHYKRGTGIDQLTGNLKLAVLSQDDPDYFAEWTELPALMLRQPHPFKILDNWQYPTMPHVLYKANNLDIGVRHGNPNK